MRYFNLLTWAVFWLMIAAVVVLFAVVLYSLAMEATASVGPLFGWVVGLFPLWVAVLLRISFVVSP